MSELTERASEKPSNSLLIRGAIWIAIGALIAAAIVCVVWVLIGDQQGLIARAFLTIVLLAGFAAIAIFEASTAPTRSEWFSLLSMIAWIIALLVGAVKIWLPAPFGVDTNPIERFFTLLLVVGILQLALLHVSLFWKASRRHVTTFTTVVTMVTFVMLGALVGMLVVFLTFPNTFEYPEIYWRIVIAITILVAVGTTLIPLLNALFAPKEKRPVHAASTLAQPSGGPSDLAPWPMYADNATPLPMLRDGSPDWNAYYTGVPTVEPARVEVPPAGATATPSARFEHENSSAAGAPGLSSPGFPPAPPPAPGSPANPAPPQ